MKNLNDFNLPNFEKNQNLTVLDTVEDVQETNVSKGGKSLPLQPFVLLPILAVEEYPNLITESGETAKGTVIALGYLDSDNKLNVQFNSVSSLHKTAKKGTIKDDKTILEDVETNLINGIKTTFSNKPSEVYNLHKNNVFVVNNQKTALYFPEYKDKKQDWNNPILKTVTTRKTVNDDNLINKINVEFKELLKNNQELKNAVKAFVSDYLTEEEKTKQKTKQ